MDMGVMSLRGVIFDMDGVLCDSLPYHYRAWERALLPYGIRMTPEINEKLRGLSRRSSLEAILDGVELPEEQVEAILEEKNRHYLKLLEGMTPADLASGVRPLLEELRCAGIRLGVASSSKNVLPTLRRLGILGFFEAITDGTISARAKPHPFPYLHTAARLGLQPADCLAVEDSPVGVQSARRAGMCVLGLGDKELVGRAHAVFPGLEGVHLADLQALHARWLERRLEKQPAARA